MRAAVYLRVSTAGQTGPDHVSLAVQEQVCREFVQRRGGDVVAVLRDEGRSGLDTERPAYLQLFELARANQVDAVVAYRFDRLGRDAAELLGATKRLRALKVELLSATEPTESNLVAGIIALLAEDESQRIRARTVPAMLARLKEGKWVTHAPAGYDVVPHPEGGKTLRHNDDAWKIRRLFEVYAEGKVSLRGLSRQSAVLELNGGKGYDRTMLSRLLRNPAYLGRSVWGRTEKLSPRHHQRRRPGDWYEAPGLHEPIISEELFASVQRMLGMNRERQGPPPPTRHLLIGRLRCGCCGSAMHAAQRKTKRYPDKVYYSYKCSAKHDGMGCSQPTVATWMLDDLVKARIEETFVLKDRDIISRAELLIASERDVHLDGLAQRKRQLERALRRHESDQRTLTRKLARGVVSERAYREAFAEMESLATSIRRELEDLAYVTVPDVSTALRIVADIDWEDLEKEDWRELIQAFCERIDVVGKNVNIAWAPEALSLAKVLATATA